MKKIYAALIIFIILVAISVAISTKNNSVNPTPSSTPVETVSPDESLGIVFVPDGWQMFSDSNLGFRINYPQTLTSAKNGDFSILFTPSSASQGQGPASFVYVSVAHSSQSNNQGEVYNYRKEDIEKLNNLAINESTTLSENRELDQWYKYTRQTDREIGGVTAKQYVNQKPWEFPNGTTETRYVLEKNGTTYLVGAYYQPGNPQSINKQTISDMVDSFSLLLGQEILE